jgi:hypothetical protein
LRKTIAIQGDRGSRLQLISTARSPATAPSHAGSRPFHEDTFSGIAHHANYLRFSGARAPANHLRLMGAEQHTPSAEAQAETPGFLALSRA